MSSSNFKEINTRTLVAQLLQISDQLRMGQVAFANLVSKEFGWCGDGWIVLELLREVLWDRCATNIHRDDQDNRK